ncbi:MAG: histidine kinase [Clostridiaceae bacterium]
MKNSRGDVMEHLKRWYRSIYAKLFIAFFIIVLPLQAIQSAMYKWGRNAVAGELGSAAASNVIYLRDNFVDNIRDLNSQMEYLLTNYTITSFFANHSHLTNWEYYSAVAQINNLLALTKNSNPYISEIILYYPSYSISLSSNQKIETVDNVKLKQLISDFRSQQSLLMEADGQSMVGHMSPSTAYFNEEMPQYFVQAVLNDSKIKSHLSSFSQYSNKNAFMLNHNTGSIISSTQSIFDNDTQISSISSLITPKDNSDVYTSVIASNKQSYIIAACYSKLINCSFVQLIPAETLQTIPERFGFFILLFNLLALAVIIIYSVIMYKLVKRPMSDLVDAFSIAGGGDFNRRLDVRYSSSEYNQLAAHFNEMTERIKTLIQTNYEQTIRMQHAELKQLQAQINPHFLYNSFFFLRHMIDRNEDQAQAFTSYLGKYFQYITKNGTDLVPLHMEYKHATNYLTIQMMRFEGRITSDVEKLPGDCRDTPVPRLILQPIFENILEHGIKKADGEGLVRLHFVYGDNGLLHIIIEDNGDQLTDEILETLRYNLITDAPLLETTGLINIHKRLQLHFGKKCGLSVTRSTLGGLCVDITIEPSQKKEDKS